jgi:hypothetical protein
MVVVHDFLIAVGDYTSGVLGGNGDASGREVSLSCESVDLEIRPHAIKALPISNPIGRKDKRPKNR